VHPQICILKIYVDRTESAFTEVHETCPKKGCFHLRTLLVWFRCGKSQRFLSGSDCPSIQTTDLPMTALDLPKASLFMYKNIIRLDGIYVTVDSIEVSKDIRCIEAEVQILRTHRVYDGTQFAGTIDESSMRRSRLHGVSILRSPNELLFLRVP
jgi:hypothetical protein